jgi:AcrR family transcriptional regulator
MSAPHVSPTRRRFDDDRLLDAARAAFHAEGYSATQTVDIAQQAGTTRPTIHTRLGSKEEIFLRVVQREADVFQEWIVDAYERGRDAPLSKLAIIGMEPIFKFAVERPEGFALLFRGDRAGDRPATLRRDVIGRVTELLTNLIEDRQLLFGSTVGPHAATLAAACVGVAVQVCEHALEHGTDMSDAHRVAASFVTGAFRHFSVATAVPSA